MTQTYALDSFFDDNSSFSFVNPRLSHQKHLNTPATLASTLSCHSPNSSFAKKSIFALHNYLLVTFPTESMSIPTSVLSLATSRLTVLGQTENNSDFLFKITRNGVSFEFSTANKQLFDRWIKALKSICVLSSFHEDFKTIKTLGKGGFATVCLVESKQGKNLYAAKAFMKKSIVASTKERAKPSLLNEIMMMRSMNHDNIVKLYEVHETDKSIYLVMELIKGKTLHDILKKNSLHKGLSENSIRDMIHSLLQALSHIASQGAMHRDIKPANILVTKEDTVKIADFGLATFIDVPNYIFKKCGTPGYMAPEVFHYNEKYPDTYYDDKSDVFGAGCILYHMLFGVPFLKGSQASEVIYINKALTPNYENFNTIRRELQDPSSKIEKEALNLLLTLLEVDPYRRPRASKALEHPYFSSMLKARKINSVGEPTAENSPFYKFTNGDMLSSSIKIQNNLKDILSIPDEATDAESFVVALHRFTTKESLYLDIGAQDSSPHSVKTSDNSSCSIINSPRFNKMENSNSGSNPNSLSSFAKPNNLQKGKSFVKSPRGLTPNVGGSQFLKAAIINNMQRQSECRNEEDEKGKIPFVRPPGRFSHEFYMYNRRSVDNSAQNNQKVEDESCEVSEGGNEEIGINLDHFVNLSRAKIPSRQAHIK